MTQIDPTEFIDIMPRGHRPRAGKELRVCFTSCTVTPETLRALNRLANDLDVSRGKMLDRLIADYSARQMANATKIPARTTTSHAGTKPIPKPQPAAPALSVKPKPIKSSRHVL
jgi:predicted transcriptional regulator